MKCTFQTEAALLFDAVMFLTKALDDLNRGKPIELRSLYCDGSATWPDGTAIVNYMKMVSKYHNLVNNMSNNK